LKQCVDIAIRNALYRWWNFQSDGSLCREQCLGTFTLPSSYTSARFPVSWVLPATEPTSIGHRQVPTRLDALGWWNCGRNILDKDNVKKQVIGKHR
jgi:hypothetical protein